MAASRVRFVYNPLFPEQVVRTVEALAVLARAVNPVEESIENSIPVVTGSYKKSFDLKLSQQPDLANARVLIVIGEGRWHIIENGSVNNPPYRPLQRGVERAGLEYVKT